MSSKELAQRGKEGTSDGANGTATPKFGAHLREEFLFDEKYLNLNHGSFGTYPRALLPILHTHQLSSEQRPDKFIRYTYPSLLSASRASLATLLNCPVSTLVFVPNATTAINTVLRGLRFAPGDKILYFATIYGACEKTVQYVCETTPAEAVRVEYTYPVEDAFFETAVREAVKKEEEKGGRIKVAVFDTVVSLPGVRMPFERLVDVCRELGVLSCVDGAHGVGHVELDLGRLDPDFFVSNCHKWLFVPRGCAIFHVPLRNQPLLPSTLPTSHGYTPTPSSASTSPSKINNPLPPSTKSPFETNFEFVGTLDNTPYLCVPAALAWREKMGGEDAILTYCHALAEKAAYRMAELLGEGSGVLQNEGGTLLGRCCLANVRLPLEPRRVIEVAAAAVKRKRGNGDAEVGEEIGEGEIGGLVTSWMCRTFVDDYDTFMALIFYGGAWWIRISAQIYLEMKDFEWAAGVLKKMCERVMEGEFLAE
ncbi:PLP-dependent transferase [Aulographum hederae CBS 113979]|uniref:PLP-dependent transferase n=1 Tax=Aulographum hederae CBS 113979 TaxID=1176131 RepID=A0A6G1HGJ8_9PEZI|nr:PLP-dependent transferase [Aulographum hederae CBS 113979]